MSQLDEPKSEVIGEHTYTVRILAPKAAGKLLHDVIQVLGPAIGAAIGNSKSVEGAAEQEIDFGNAISVACQRLDWDTMLRHMEILAAVSEVDGKLLKPIFDAHFHGKLGEMTRWYYFALKANLGDFSSAFPEGSGLLKSLLGKAK